MAHERIVTDPAVMYGKPVIRGTRVTVEHILRQLAEGASPDAIIKEHPRLRKIETGCLMARLPASFFAAVLNHARINGLLSDEHFSVDGTLIQAWASMKSFRPKDGSGKPPGSGRNGRTGF